MALGISTKNKSLCQKPRGTGNLEKCSRPNTQQGFLGWKIRDPCWSMWAAGRFYGTCRNQSCLAMDITSTQITRDVRWCDCEEILMGCASPGGPGRSPEVTRDGHVREEAGSVLLCLKLPPAFNFHTRLAPVS